MLFFISLSLHLDYILICLSPNLYLMVSYFLLIASICYTNKSGRGRKKPWKFFSKLDEILATRPNTQPHTVIDSSFVDAEPGVASEVEEDQESIKDHEGMSHISSINTTFYVCCIISMSYN